jgi:hypothetical protein
MVDINQVYLESSKKQFLYYKTLGEKAMGQLEPDQLFVSMNEDSNSIATIVKHLSGNMLSRWTDFLTTDGEKPWRARDAEFENDITDKDQLLLSWDEAWHCLFLALESIGPEQLSQIIYIRNEGHTVMEAINRQLAHYPYHIGQMIYAAKILKKSTWDSLSIPRNSSSQYNNDKFAKDKTTQNFTDEELKRLQ